MIPGISHYKLGVLRGGWDPHTPVEHLYSKGLITENLTTHMLAGTTLVNRPADEEAIQTAATNISNATLVADAAKLDELCGSVLGAFRCPDVMIFRGNPTELELEPEKLEEIAFASRQYDSHDWRLFDTIKNKLLFCNEEFKSNSVGDGRSYFVLLMPTKSVPGGIEAVRVEKSKLPEMQTYLAQKYSDQDIQVELPDHLSNAYSS